LELHKRKKGVAWKPLPSDSLNYFAIKVTINA
jgi:hypothetical protein